MAVTEEPVDILPVVDDAPAERYQEAARLLERAAQGASSDPSILYMLAMAYKQLGRIPDARASLRRIVKPDANVYLQLGLLSLREKQLAQAAEELQKAWDLDRTSYEVCYNLLMTRLTLGQLDASLELVPRAIDLAARREQSSPETGHGDRHFLQVLHALLRCSQDGRPAAGERILTELSAAEEKQILRLLRGLGQVEVVQALLKILGEARPRSGPVREAYVEAALASAKALMDRGCWTETEMLLRPLAREKGVSRATQTALLNLLGCCSCLTQDFPSGERFFQAALKLAPGDPRLHQNLALCHELNGDMAEADPHWNQFFDLLDRRLPAPPEIPSYIDRLAFEGISRLASTYAEKERWNSALTYVQQANRLRPDDPDTLERLFHLYNQVKKPAEARRALDRLRRLRPDDPQLDLYELDLIEVRGLGDIERLLTEIDAILRRYPDDPRVEERAVGMVGNVIPLMGNLCDQLTDQMSKVIDQVRNLPNYQINWSAVREVMRDLLKEFQKLRRITGKCLPLVKNEEHRRIIHDLADHIDRKMEACRSMGA